MQKSAKRKQAAASPASPPAGKAARPGEPTPQAKADEWLYTIAENAEADQKPYDLQARLKNHPTDVLEAEWATLADIAEQSKTERAPQFTLLVFSAQVSLPRTTDAYKRVIEEVRRDPSLASEALWAAFAEWLREFAMIRSRNFVALAALAHDELFNTPGVMGAEARPARARRMAAAVCARLRKASSNKSLGYFLWRYAELDVPLGARALAERDNFYALKRGQNIDDLDQDVYITDERFPRQTCRLWTDYSYCRVLGAGSYGITLDLARYSPLSPDPRHYAVKLQAISNRANAGTLAYRELRCLYEVMLLARHWSAERIRQPFNHVRLLDWDRCNFSLRGRIAHLMDAKERKEYAKSLESEGRDYQIIVEEFADGGTYRAFIESKPAVATTREFFAASMTQLFSFLYAVGSRTDLVHGDLKPENVLISRVPISSPYTHLLYAGETDGTFVFPTRWVPVAHSLMLVFKIADYGLSRMNSVRLSPDDPDAVWVTPIGAELRAWLPGVDMLSWAAMWLYSITAVKGIFPSELDPAVREVLLHCLKPFKRVIDSKVQSIRPPDLALFNASMDIIRNHFDPAHARSKEDITNALAYVYSKCNEFTDWIDLTDETHGELHLRAMFDLPLFRPYRTRPPDVTSKPLLMTDYAVTVESDWSPGAPDQSSGSPQAAKSARI